MEKIIYLIILTLALFGCEKNDAFINYDKIDLQPYIIENHTHDAKQLYFNEIINDSTHTNFNDPILNNVEIEKILKIIQAVYNSNSPERDSVFNKYTIHGYYCYSFKSISLTVETDKPEIKNLSNGIIPSGETNLDKIISNYKFDSVKTSYSYPNFPWLTIYTKDEFNMIPIVKELSDLESVRIAESNKWCIGDGKPY